MGNLLIKNISKNQFKDFIKEFDMHHSYILHNDESCLHIDPSTLDNFFFLSFFNLSCSFIDTFKKPVWIDKILDVIVYFHFSFNNTIFLSQKSKRLKNNKWLLEDNSEKTKINPDVYFIQAIIGGPIKIGVSITPKFRLEALQPSSPFKLRIIATIPRGGYKLESKLHKKFKDNHLHGEWFEPSKEILNYISKTKKGESIDS
jgi:hypothetical protein